MSESNVPDGPLAYHEFPRPGKIEVVPTKALATQRDLGLAYTPGVAEPCMAIYHNPDDVYRYTAKGNLVAVVTNGTAVLGLGNIGPLAGKPVMEGKANLFKKFADVDVFDIELDANTVDEMVAAVKAIAPTFGGINLEDIKAPECFEVERRLQEELDIPVFHDDQHGTAIISAAALLNSCEITGRKIEEVTIVFSGAGAAAIACANLYVALGARVENITMCDTKGVIHTDRADLTPQKRVFATRRSIRTLAEALVGADCFVGLSVANALTPAMIMPMAKSPIIFAMANPDPEIPFAVAREARPDAIVATGRSDNPNQVNNVLGFPFVFRGALDCRARKVTEAMKLAATRAIAALTREDVPDSVLRAYGLHNLRFGPDYIIPKPFDPRVLVWVAPAVAEAAAQSGVARIPIKDLDAYREHLWQLVQRARGLMYPLISRARASQTKRIAFTDGATPSVLRAAQILVDEKICTPVLVGTQARIEARAKELGVSLNGIEIEQITEGAKFDAMADALFHDRARKGVTAQGARALIRDNPAYYGAMMVKTRDVHGMVGGFGRPYRDTLSPAVRVLGTDGTTNVVSGVYAMLFKNRRFYFGDCTVNIDPDAETLAGIALNTARVAETFGDTPRVAMLSYSDFGEHYQQPGIDKVRQAVEIVRRRRPDLIVDGEMQADTAVSREKMEAFPFSRLKEPANVLVFPALPSGNIAYKLLIELTDAEALGPLVVGLGGPVSVIPVGATVAQIVHQTTFTVIQALDRVG